jgi:hypothetical protein
MIELTVTVDDEKLRQLVQSRGEYDSIEKAIADHIRYQVYERFSQDAWKTIENSILDEFRSWSKEERFVDDIRGKLNKRIESAIQVLAETKLSESAITKNFAGRVAIMVEEWLREKVESELIRAKADLVIVRDKDYQDSIADAQKQGEEDGYKEAKAQL